MRRLALLLLLLFATAALAQTDNTYFVKQYITRPGMTVADGVNGAQAACNSDTSITCRIVFDPTLAKYPQGTLPAPCAQCIWERWDVGTSPTMVLSAYACSNCNVTNGSQANIRMTFDRPIRVVEFRTTGFTPSAGCTQPTVFRVSTSPPTTSAQYTVANASTLTATTGPIAIDLDAGSTLNVDTVTTSCTTSPGNVNYFVLYKMR